METKDCFRTEFLSWDDVSHLGESERDATILDEGRFKPSKYSENKQNFVITIQLVKNKELFEFRVNKRTWRNFKEVWGTESKNWREKTVKIMPFVYAEGKNGTELVPTERKSFKPEVAADLSNKEDDLLNEYIEKVKKAFTENKG